MQLKFSVVSLLILSSAYCLAAPTPLQDGALEARAPLLKGGMKTSKEGGAGAYNKPDRMPPGGAALESPATKNPPKYSGNNPPKYQPGNTNELHDPGMLGHTPAWEGKN